MRKWIHNDTEVRCDENADAGFEIEVVLAREYNEIVDELVQVHAALRRCALILECMDTMPPKAWRAARADALAMVKKCNPWRGTSDGQPVKRES